MKTGPISEQRNPERRRHPRSGGVTATAVVLAENRYAGAFVVEDLSAGGALLIGDPRLDLGEYVNILLQLEGKRPLHLWAEVVRHQVREAGEHLFAVAFRNMRATEEDRIQGAVLSALERRRASPDASVLVVDDAPEIHRALQRDLHAFGVGMLSAATPLEAVRHLQDPDVQIDIALVDLHLGHADGTDVLAFLAEDHPEIRRVLMSGRARPCQLELALSSGRAHEVLSKPWERRTLANLLSRC